MDAAQSALRSVVLSALLCVTTTSALAATTYRVDALSGLEANSADSYGIAIGPTGNVAGMSFRLDSYASVLWDNTGTIRELIPGDVGESQAYDINAKDQVLLYHYGPYIWENGVLTPVYINVSSAPLVGPLAFNDSAQVMGTGYFMVGSAYQLHAFLVSDGLTSDLGVLPGATASWANGINNNGDVVGYSYSPDKQQRAVLWRNGSIIDLGVLPGEASSVANDINDRGQVVGSSGNRLFVWQNGVMTDLGKYSDSTSVRARAINNKGDIIGAITIPGSYDGSAFVRSNGVFNDIGPVLKNGRRCTADAINDAGQITMNCGSIGGAYVLSPTTPATDLGVVVYASAYPTTNQGSPLTYTIEVSNVGSLVASNVQLSDVLPASVTFVSANTSQGSCSGTSSIACALGNLASGAKATVQLTVIPNVAGGLGHSVSVASDEAEANTANNTTSAGVYVAAAPADLGVSMTDSPDPAKRGANLTYSINVKNSGPASATGVTVTDTLPSSMSFVSARSSQGSCSGTSTITCALGSMANGAGASVTIVVQPRTAGTYSNSARVSASSPDSNLANNSASVATKVK